MARILTVLIIGGLLAAVAGLGFVFVTFFLGPRSALDAPSDAEIFIAEQGKSNFLIPGDVAARVNPKATLNGDSVADARRTFTVRCNVCHGTDGKGQTPIGQNTHPRAADLTSARTQGRTDGSLFWLIGNGLPHTGMPGWKNILKDDDIWQLVAYLRLLPQGQDAISRLLPTPTPSPTPLPTPTAAPTAVRAATTLTVTVFDYMFPSPINVAAGTRVVWANTDDEEHNVVSEEKPRALDLPFFKKGATVSFVFTQPGTYKYFCELHDYMHGIVVVK